MNEEPGFVDGVLRDLAASTAAILAGPAPVALRREPV